MDKLAIMVANSKLNCRYIHPSVKLANNIISHAITSDQWYAIYNEYILQNHPKKCLVTRYYDNNYILTETKGSYHEKNYQIIFRNHHHMIPEYELEYVGENNFSFDLNLFPVKHRYNHERQSITYTFTTGNVKLEMELLIKGIESYDVRLPLLNLPVKQLLNNEHVFSYSYKLYCLKGITADEIKQHMEILYTEKKNAINGNE